MISTTGYLIVKIEDAKEYFWDWIKDNWVDTPILKKKYWTIFSTKEEAENCYNHLIYITPKEDKDKIQITKVNISFQEITESE